MVVPLARVDPGAHASLKLAVLALATGGLALGARLQARASLSEWALRAFAIGAVASTVIAGAPIATAVPVLVALSCLAILPRVLAAHTPAWSVVERAVVLSVLGVAAIAMLELLGMQLPWASLRRPASTLGNRNHVAQFFVIALPVVVSAAANRRRHAGLALALATTIIIVARCRGAYLALGAPLGLLAVMAWRRPGLRSVIGALGIGAALGLMPWPGVSFDGSIASTATRVLETEGTGADRLRQHAVGLAAIEAHPTAVLVGFGAGSWQRVRAEYAVAGGELAPRFSGAAVPNSEPLRILVEQGLFGIAAVLVALIAAIRQARHRPVVVASLGAAMIIGLFDPLLVRPECVALLGVLVGASAPGPVELGPPRRPLIAAVLASLLVAVCVLRAAAFIVASPRSLDRYRPGSAAWEAQLDTAASLFPLVALDEKRALGLAARGRCRSARRALERYSELHPHHWGARAVVSHCVDRTRHNRSSLEERTP